MGYLYVRVIETKRVAIRTSFFINYPFIRVKLNRKESRNTNFRPGVEWWDKTFCFKIESKNSSKENSIIIQARDKSIHLFGSDWLGEVEINIQKYINDARVHQKWFKLGKGYKSHGREPRGFVHLAIQYIDQETVSSRPFAESPVEQIFTFEEWLAQSQDSWPEDSKALAYKEPEPPRKLSTSSSSTSRSRASSTSTTTSPSLASTLNSSSNTSSNDNQHNCDYGSSFGKLKDSNKSKQDKNKSKSKNSDNKEKIKNKNNKNKNRSSTGGVSGDDTSSYQYKRNSVNSESGVNNSSGSSDDSSCEDYLKGSASPKTGQLIDLSFDYGKCSPSKFEGVFTKPELSSSTQSQSQKEQQSFQYQSQFQSHFNDTQISTSWFENNSYTCQKPNDGTTTTTTTKATSSFPVSWSPLPSKKSVSG